MFLRHLIFLVLTISTVYTATVPPIPPTQDPFYTPVTGFEQQPVGTILKWRPIPGSLGFLVIPEKVHAGYQLMFRSNDALGQPILAVSTILVPKNADPTKLLSYQIEEDSSSLDCAPSYTLQLGSRVDGLISQIDFLLIQAALNQGYYVNIPDYEGLKSAFTVGQLAGRVVLDSFRAALSSTSITGINPAAEIIAWGYSGGSIASGWAAQLHTTYAPELNLIGAALGGVVPNISAVLLAVNKGPFAGLIPAGINGVANQYPQIVDVLKQYILPSKAPLFQKADTQCLATDIVEYIGQDFFTWTYGGDAFLYDPRTAQVIQENTLGVTPYQIPRIPLYIYHSMEDEIAPVGSTDLLYNTYCAEGVKINYQKSLISDHVTEMIEGAGGAFRWIINRFNGAASQPSCSTTTTLFTGALNIANLEVFGTIIAGDLLGLLGKTLGPPSL